LVLGQVKVDDKSSEITAIPALLALLDQQFQLWNSPVKNRLNFKLGIHEFEQVTPTVKD
jgi:hypothetical protein